MRPPMSFFMKNFFEVYESMQQKQALLVHLLQGCQHHSANCRLCSLSGFSSLRKIGSGMRQKVLPRKTGIGSARNWPRQSVAERIEPR
jgi:hypothetical protein